MSKKTTKRALAMSFVSVFLCVCMLVGTTFAWFTDSVTSSNNIIKSGTLDVTMEWADGTKAVPAADSTDWKDASKGAIFNNDLWEPGYTEVRHIKIGNKGTLALKYQLSITPDGENSKLTDVIDVYYFDGAKQITSRTELTDANKIGTLTDALAGMTTTASGNLKAGDNHTVTIALKMRESATNEYQDLGIGSEFAVQLLATQLTAETDSFDDQYDAAAKFDVSVWDGTTVTTPVADANGVYHISTAADLVGMMNVTGNSIYKGKTIVLDNNIDLGGRTVKGIGGMNTNFAGVFDGQGYTISNFKIESDSDYYAGLFNQVSHGGTIKNLTVKNATIVGKSMVGAVASSLDNAVIDNCKAIDCTLIGVKKVGAVVGYSAGSTVTNNYAENCTVIYSEKEGGEILGYQNTGSTVSNNTANNVSVKQGVAVSSADELTDAIANGASTVVLGSGNYIIPDSAKGKTLTIVGNGDTVVAAQDDGGAEGDCDYSFSGSTVTFENVTITTSATYFPGYAGMKGIYNNCTINGVWTLYDNSEFNNCTFNVSGDVYNVWTWGASIATFNDCVFNNDGKAILLYGGANTKLTVNDCTFNDKGGLTDLKAAIEIGNDYGTSYELIVNDTVVNGYAINDKGINTGTTLWANKNSMGTDKLNVVVDGVDVY